MSPVTTDLRNRYGVEFHVPDPCLKELQATVNGGCQGEPSTTPWHPFSLIGPQSSPRSEVIPKLRAQAGSVRPRDLVDLQRSGVAREQRIEVVQE